MRTEELTVSVRDATSDRDTSSLLRRVEQRLVAAVLPAAGAAHEDVVAVATIEVIVAAGAAQIRFSAVPDSAAPLRALEGR